MTALFVLLIALVLGWATLWLAAHRFLLRRRDRLRANRQEQWLAAGWLPAVVTAAYDSQAELAADVERMLRLGYTVAGQSSAPTSAYRAWGGWHLAGQRIQIVYALRGRSPDRVLT